jgi:predicted nucleic acid-binding protein
MGNGHITLAVADAGPIIHLAETGGLALLRICDSLNIPDAVWSEVVAPGRVSPSVLLALDNIQRHTLSSSAVLQFINDNHLDNLHTGECEALYLCQVIHSSLLLTDDLAARDAARGLGITPVGSLGVVVRAYRLDQISLTDADRQIADLYDVSSLFVTKAIVELAIEQLRKAEGQSREELDNK